LPTDLSLTDNFHKFQLKILGYKHQRNKKQILLKRDENKSMKRKICDPCHEKKVVKNVRYYVATSEESEDITTQTSDD
jgi:hypothetical protein